MLKKIDGKKLVEYESQNELVEYRTLLPFIVKKNRDSDEWTKIEKWNSYSWTEGVSNILPTMTSS